MASVNFSNHLAQTLTISLEPEGEFRYTKELMVRDVVRLAYMDDPI